MGTANRIVLLGSQYLELVGVVDPTEAEASPFGRSVLERSREGDGWLTLAASSDDVGAVAARLGLEVRTGSRVLPDGAEIRWRMAGLDDPRRAAWMPFFITWDIPRELHPGAQRAGHGVRAEGLAWVEVGGDASLLLAWLGGEDLPLRVTYAPAGIIAVAVATPGGELVIC